jgi:hypothetical protein
MENILENELARRMGSLFSERKTTQILHAFSTKLTFLQFCVNFFSSLYSTKQFLNQTECILGFPMYQLFECHGYDIQMNSHDFWRPDDGRNCTCFFVWCVI